MFLTSKMFFFLRQFLVRGYTATAGSLQRGRPKSQSQSQSGGSKPQERGRGLDAAIPKRDVCWLCLVVFVAWIFCVFFCVVKLFDLEFLNDTTG